MKFRNQLHPSWQSILSSYLDLLDDIESAISVDQYLPEHDCVMRALSFDFAASKVLILGQDPYPNPDCPVGLSFSVPRSLKKFPPTLRNIFKELSDDIGAPIPSHGDLSKWTEQGVVLLNRILTGRPNESNSHVNIGWREITDVCVKALAEAGVVAILWGAKAQEVKDFFQPDRLITSAHPSPLSAYRDFFGSKPFSSANAALIAGGEKPIDWSL